jgi:hypothetical protein
MTLCNRTIKFIDRCKTTKQVRTSYERKTYLFLNSTLDFGAFLTALLTTIQATIYIFMKYTSKRARRGGHMLN